MALALLLAATAILITSGGARRSLTGPLLIAGLAAEKFLILPHAEVAEYFKRKATDYDRWLRGMRKLRAQNQ